MKMALNLRVSSLAIETRVKKHSMLKPRRIGACTAVVFLCIQAAQERFCCNYVRNLCAK
jgi:hypothetical protein